LLDIGARHPVPALHHRPAHARQIGVVYLISLLVRHAPAAGMVGGVFLVCLAWDWVQSAHTLCELLLQQGQGCAVPAAVLRLTDAAAVAHAEQASTSMPAAC
jgi:hypothetical protein